MNSTMNRLMNPSVMESKIKYSKKKDPDVPFICVNCYSDGKNWVIPDPKNEIFSELHFNNYKKGKYIKRKAIKISISNYNNPSHWLN